jgi:hypothetical protein
MGAAAKKVRRRVSPQSALCSLEQPSPLHAVRTPGGASAEVDGERLVLRDTRGCIVVVYDAERGTAQITAPKGDLVLSAPHGKIALKAREVECEAGRIDLRADRIFERARDIYRDVEGLIQTRAERVRTLATGAYQLFAGRVNVLAEEDAAVDGKRVLLG